MRITITLAGLNRLRAALAGVYALMLADAAHEAMQRAYRAGVPSPRIEPGQLAPAWRSTRLPARPLASGLLKTAEQFEAEVARVLAERDERDEHAPWRAIVAQCVGGDGDTSK